MNEWIKCSDRLPGEGQSVLIWERGNVPISALYTKKEGKYRQWQEFCNCHCGDGEGPGFYQREVSHWMPLPEIPNE